ncbi:MAG: EAL domain-containing protein [Chloroflexota bacterium]|nr:EAL domain-containing protein [Chloroflexota bacterium]MDE3193541.1 EAL domain-containing protein [Chloroflexota bacterium]
MGGALRRILLDARLTALAFALVVALPVLAYVTLAEDAVRDGFGAATIGLGGVPLALLAVTTIFLTREHRRTIRQRDRLREMQQTARIGSWRYDVRTGRVSGSRQLMHVVGLPPGRSGVPLETFLDRVHRDDRQRVHASLMRAIEARTRLETRFRLTAPSGQPYVVEIRAADDPGHDGRAAEVRGTVQDITELYRGEEQRAQLLAQVDSVDEAVIGTTLDGTVTEWNAGAERLFGYSRSEMVGRDIRILRPSGSRTGSAMMLAGIRAGRRMDRQELDRMRKDGSRVDVAVSGTPVWNASGDVVAATFTYWDVARQKRLENELAERVSHDPLTGLPNRFLLRDRLDQALRVAERSGEPLALLEVDVDRFRDVNDAIGQQGGDALLMDAAARIQTELRAVDTVARIGTDVFAVVVPGADESAASLVAARLRSVLQQPFEIARHEIDVEVSVGVTLAPAHGNDVATLLRRCEIALAAAKRSRVGYALFAPDAGPEKPSRVIVLAELRQAIERGELRLDYQPEVDLRTAETVRVEALVRWMHPTRGLVAPLDFIPVVEDTGLVGPLTRWVLTEATRQCRAWSDAGIAMPVAVNLSARSLLDPELVDGVGDALAASGLRGEMLTVEITEGVLMTDARRARTVIDGLHSLGVRVALDDFGTGYSSFAYLDTLPIDEMKIDRSLLLGLERDRSRAIVGTMIDLGHHLGFEVVAEGVEEAGAAERLTELGCDTLQGFSIARPMSAVALVSWLRERGERVTRARRTVVRRIAAGGAA